MQKISDCISENLSIDLIHSFPTEKSHVYTYNCHYHEIKCIEKSLDMINNDFIKNFDIIYIKEFSDEPLSFAKKQILHIINQNKKTIEVSSTSDVLLDMINPINPKELFINENQNDFLKSILCSKADNICLYPHQDLFNFLRSLDDSMNNYDQKNKFNP